jgi:hypothetical protein
VLRIFHVHVHGGRAADIAAKLKPALALIGKSAVATAGAAPAKTLAGPLDTALLAKTIGHPERQPERFSKSRLAGPTSRWLRWHRHMTGTDPNVIFLHYWGRGPAQKLAAGVRVALDQLARPAR